MKMLYEMKSQKAFYDKLDSALQELVNRYKSYFSSHKKDRVFMLNNFARDLERISNLLDNYNYTYRPAGIPDVSEDVFEVMVMRYLDGFQRYIDEGESNLETLNVDIKNLLTLVDKHKNISEHFI